MCSARTPRSNPLDANTIYYRTPVRPAASLRQVLVAPGLGDQAVGDQRVDLVFP